MGKLWNGTGLGRLCLAGIAAISLAACDENGEFALPSATGTASNAEVLPSNAPNQRITEQDVERPDLFSRVDRGLWDGRPSLGGVWVAHPDVQEPERVLIRNAENGEEIIGALFRRERENPGPVFQISSDAAEELGILPGAPVDLRVVALRREEVVTVLPEVETNPVVESLDAPVNVIAEPLEAAQPVATEPQAAALPPVVEAATAVVEETALAATATAAQASEEVVASGSDVIDVSSILGGATPPADGPRAQVGVYSVEANANGAAAQITQSGIAAEVTPQTMGGRTVWRVVAGPMVDENGVAQLKALGFVDAFIVADTEE